jgi:hypothetical protein
MNAFRAWIVALAIALALPALAQTNSASTDMQIFLQKVKADKKLIVATSMRLSDAEAKGFWPIYDAYQKELDVITKRLINTITTYAEAYKKGTVPNDTAKKLIDEALAIEEAEVRLKRTYLPKLEKALPGSKVARYIQLENKIRAGVRFELAASIPLVE